MENFANVDFCLKIKNRPGLFYYILLYIYTNDI